MQTTELDITVDTSVPKRGYSITKNPVFHPFMLQTNVVYFYFDKKHPLFNCL